MSALKTTNLALAFLLEMGALMALAFWGFGTGSDALVNLILGIGAPVIVALVWGMFVAPRATRPLSPNGKMVLRVLVFGAAALGLAAAGQPTLAVIFAVLVAINLIFMRVWKQDAAASQ